MTEPPRQRCFLFRDNAHGRFFEIWADPDEDFDDVVKRAKKKCCAFMSFQDYYSPCRDGCCPCATDFKVKDASLGVHMIEGHDLRENIKLLEEVRKWAEQKWKRHATIVHEQEITWICCLPIFWWHTGIPYVEVKECVGYDWYETDHGTVMIRGADWLSSSTHYAWDYKDPMAYTNETEPKLVLVSVSVSATGKKTE